MIKVKSTELDGVLLIEPKVFGDKRGYFFESFSQRDFNEATGLDVNFVQDNESFSCKNVVRGLHFQMPPYTQAKLVRCVRGRVLDVAVDLRKDSPTYGKHIGVVLSEENHLQLFIPRGFAHGFAVLSDEAMFQYKCDQYYAPESNAGISLNDPSLGIDWMVDLDNAILSDNDLKHPLLADFKSPF